MCLQRGRVALRIGGARQCVAPIQLHRMALLGAASWGDALQPNTGNSRRVHLSLTPALGSIVAAFLQSARVERTRDH